MDWGRGIRQALEVSPDTVESRISNMNVADVQRRLRRIQRVKADNEVAHVEQDELYEAVLEALANDGSMIALEALKAREIKFKRWYA